MIAPFAAYQLLVSALFALAALGTEQAFALRRWPRRLVWAFALATSIGFPLAMALTTAPAAPQGFTVESPTLTEPGSTPTLVEPAPKPWVAHATMPAPPASKASEVAAAPWSVHLSPEKLVIVLWPASSMGMLLLYAVASIRLAVGMRRCPTGRIFGTPVRLTPQAGPAVFGLWRPMILWPSWLRDVPEVIQRAAIAHEREHLHARDPALLGGALLLVALAPWNPALWWQLRRLRFAIEADCDQRVVRRGTEASGYAEVLWHIGKRRTNPPGRFTLLMSAPSWLERRIRLLLLTPRRLSTWLGYAVVPLVAALLAGAAAIHAPGLTVPELRKLPGQDTRLAAQWAVTLTHTRFPELLNRPFDGSAVVAAVFDRDGRLQLASKHLFARGTAAADFDMAEENKQLGIDPDEDILYRGNESAPFTIGPWLKSKNAGRLFIVYEVLKWRPDASRRSDRVLAGLRNYDPALLQPASPRSGVWTSELTVFMNNDGTVSRVQRRGIPNGQPVTEDDLQRFAAMGIAAAQLGRRGFAMTPGVRIDYAWPRRPDDTADVAELNTAWRAIYRAHPPRQDEGDDGAIFRRYFPEIARAGYPAVTERMAGKRALLTPWILFGRDGRVWGTGLWHQDSRTLNFGGPIIDAVEAHYPGVGVEMDRGGWTIWRFRGVPIASMWVSANSPIQRKADIDSGERRDLLITGGVFLGRTSPTPNGTILSPYEIQFASTQNFGSVTGIRLFPQTRQVMQLIATPVSAQEVSLQLRLAIGGSVLAMRGPLTQWTDPITLHARYGSPAVISVGETSAAHLGISQIIVRAERLRK